MSQSHRPLVSVVIPTYNRSALLGRTLASLAAQSLPADQFEVIVSDDGSSDDTERTARSFADRLRLRYRFQEDLGFRAATARNEGARLAEAPVLVFLDTGSLAGPDLVRGHLEAQRAGECAVAGYAHGYQPWGSSLDVAALLETKDFTQVVAEHRDDPGLTDYRTELLPRFDLAANPLAVPWLIFWSLNCSVPAERFWAVGGFDDGFSSWGSEDMELGLRLHRAGLPIVASAEAWAFEYPHDRDMRDHVETNLGNGERILHKHPEPVTELLWFVYQSGSLWPVEGAYRDLLAWTEKARGIGVRPELEYAAPDASRAADGRTVVLGCGSDIPEHLAGALLVDFDEEVVRRLKEQGHPRVRHAVGVNTGQPLGSADTVIVTSRLSGLWPTLGRAVLREAQRLGGKLVLALDPGAPAAGATPEPAGDPEVVAFLVGQWRELLGQPTLQADDHFFRNNGTSVQAAHLVGRLKKRYGVKLTLKNVFQAPTPNSLSRVVDERQAAGRA